ncbi:hypothetical protein RJT34_04870 [Clitoria ternatea]|uniref:Uncharacterized protein n=1 Tax=Clitoria ternatea TaxID=43366 RepID=A0AAN9Q2N9_CLITE
MLWIPRKSSKIGSVHVLDFPNHLHQHNRSSYTLSRFGDNCYVAVNSLLVHLHLPQTNIPTLFFNHVPLINLNYCFSLACNLSPPIQINKSPTNTIAYHSNIIVIGSSLFEIY